MMKRRLSDTELAVGNFVFGGGIAFGAVFMLVYWLIKIINKIMSFL